MYGMSQRISSCELEIRVRYAECDPMGYLHHSKYFEYFEMGRTELLRQGGAAYRDLEQAGVFFVVAKCSARFLAPARYDDLLVLTTRITRMGAARIDHAYELKRKEGSLPRAESRGLLLATAETTLACVDRTGRIIAIPDSMRVPENQQG